MNLISCEARLCIHVVNVRLSRNQLLDLLATAFMPFQAPSCTLVAALHSQYSCHTIAQCHSYARCHSYTGTELDCRLDTHKLAPYLCAPLQLAVDRAREWLLLVVLGAHAIEQRRAEAVKRRQIFQQLREAWHLRAADAHAAIQLHLQTRALVCCTAVCRCFRVLQMRTSR